MHTERRANDISGDEKRSPSSLHGHVALVALVLALVFVLFEVTQAAQERFWTGGSWRQWADAGLGFLMYAGVLWAGTGVLALSASRLLRLSRHIDLVAVLSGLIVALAAWWCLSREAGPAGQGQWGVYAVLLLGAGACAALRLAGFLGVPGFCAVGIASLGAATASIPIVTHLVLTYPQRGALASAIPWGWAAVTMVAGTVTAGMGGRAGDSKARRAAGVVLLAAALPLALEAAPWLVPRKGTAGGHNVLVITADALRADICSVYGGDTATPALEGLAARGILFRKAYAAAPWTVPSLCALFSSKYPPGLTPGANDEQRELEELSYHKFGPYFLDEDGRTFVERLQYNEQYATGAYIGNMAILYQHWLLSGFAEVRFLDTLSYSARGRFDLLPVLQAAVARVYPPLVRERTMDSTETLVKYANDYIVRHRNENFFLWVHLMDPHTPFDPPEAYRSGVPEAGRAWQEFPPRPIEDRIELAGNMSASEIRLARELYRGEVRYIDWAVGDILRAVRRNGLENRTYVCFSSDHGEELYERGRYGHGYSMYDQLVRVPLIVAGPGLGQEAVDTPVSEIDLVPTFADLLGAPARPEWRGRSLVPMMRGEPAAAQPVYAQATHHFRYRPEPMQMVLAWPWKLIRGLETGRKELYHLAEDPAETRDVAETQPREAGDLSALLAEWSNTFPVSFEHYGEAPTAAVGEVPSDLREIFENQGYLGEPGKSPAGAPE